MLISPDQAYQAVMQAVKPLPSQIVDLSNSLGMTLARPIKADRDLPPVNLSAMDGYAIQAQDASTETCRLAIIGECAAGNKPDVIIRKGQAARIYTGAMLPKGADAVAIVEQCSDEQDHVIVRGKIPPNANIFQRGENAARGEVLLPKGEPIGSPQIGVCAAVGAASVSVIRFPKIMVLCTGEELRSANESVKPYETRNSNGPMLQAALQEWRFESQFQIVPDSLSKIKAAIQRNLKKHDVIILTGGVSKGRYDFVKEAIEQTGGRVRFHGVAMKPGKPQLFATAGKNQCIFGLPGNPLSAMTGLHELVLPALRRMAGRPIEQCRHVFQAVLANPVESKGDRLRFVLGRLHFDGPNLCVEPVESQSSADIAASGRADGALLVPKDARQIQAGAVVEFRPWKQWPS
ncbi:MAG: molybdopterin molybdotransferase MoeA [Candidatus Hinthialibacter antarcticus]|nr:molybdopterin molybdotransferase MoeA [Candidatus Hinthialibacter antarcticus]